MAMSFLVQNVSVPIWFLILMNVIMLLLLMKVFSLVYRFKRGDIIKEEHSDMVVWKIKSRKPAVPSAKSSAEAAMATEQKERQKKEELVQVLKILLKEGEKGVLMQTIADRMGSSLPSAKHAMNALIEKKLVDEVIGVSGTKYYLSQSGREYCLSKAR